MSMLPSVSRSSRAERHAASIHQINDTRINIWLCKYSDVIMKPWQKLDTPSQRANGGSRSTDFCVFDLVCVHANHTCCTHTSIYISVYIYLLSLSPAHSLPLSSRSLALSTYLCLLLSQCLFVFVSLSSVCVCLKHASLCYTLLNHNAYIHQGGGEGAINSEGWERDFGFLNDTF